MGGDAGAGLFKFGGKWKINNIYSDYNSQALAVIQGPSKLETWKKQPLQSRNAFRTEILKLFPGFAGYQLNVIYEDGTSAEYGDAASFISKCGETERT